MISIDDIIDMTGLTPDEVSAIAEHEHCSEACAAAMADYLLHKPDGAEAIRQMISDDIRHALRHGNRAHATELLAALKHFIAQHPEVARH